MYNNTNHHFSYIFERALTYEAIFDIIWQLKEYSANIVLFFQDQLSFVAAMTNTQTATRRRRASAVSSSPEKSTASQLSVVAGANIMKTPELQCMKPLLRFLQLLCENHHTKMQVWNIIVHGIPARVGNEACVAYPTLDRISQSPMKYILYCESFCT